MTLTERLDRIRESLPDTEALRALAERLAA